MFKLMILIVSLSYSFASSANLITNGSFEDNKLNHKRWQHFAADKVNGWQGSNIEIWNDLYGFESFSGNQHIELNSHPNTDIFSIYQDFDTTINQGYSLNFAYAARTKKNEQFLVEVISGDDLLFNQLFDDHLFRTWQTFTDSFIATSAITQLRFTAIFPQRTVGNLIDDIQVLALGEQRLSSLKPQAVDSPAMLISLFLAGALFIGLKRKKQS